MTPIVPLLRKSVKARNDLAEILRYGIGSFGDRVGREYVRSFDSAFARIVAAPEGGTAVDYLLPRMRKLRHRKHFIFFRPMMQQVLVVRVLHQAMDAEQQFRA